LLLALAPATGADGVSSSGGVPTTEVAGGLSLRLGGGFARGDGLFLRASSLTTFGGGLAVGFSPVGGLELGWSFRGSRALLAIDDVPPLTGASFGDQRLMAKYIVAGETFSFGGLLALDVPAPSGNGEWLGTIGGELGALGSLAAGPVRVHGLASFRLDRSGVGLPANPSAFEVFALQQSRYDRLRVAAVGELPILDHVLFASVSFEQPVGGPEPVAIGALAPRVSAGARLGFELGVPLALTFAVDSGLGAGGSVPNGLPIASPLRFLLSLAAPVQWPKFPEVVPTPDPIDDGIEPVAIEPSVEPVAAPPASPEPVASVPPDPVTPDPVAPAPTIVPEPPRATVEPVVAATPETPAPVVAPTPAELSAHFKRAVELQKDAAYGEAATELEFVATHSPKMPPELLYNLGFVHRLSGDHDAAIDEFSRFVELAPKSPKVAEVERFMLDLTKEKRRRADSGGDVYPPRLTDRTPARWRSGTPTSIAVEITDRTGVFEATLSYRFGSSAFVQLPLVKAGPTRWEAAMPPLPPGQLEWYVDAVDGQGNLARSGTATHPHVVRIE